MSFIVAVLSDFLTFIYEILTNFLAVRVTVTGLVALFGEVARFLVETRFFTADTVTFFTVVVRNLFSVSIGDISNNAVTGFVIAGLCLLTIYITAVTYQLPAT